MSKRHHGAFVRAHREYEENETSKPRRNYNPNRRELDEDYDLDLEEYDYKPAEKIRRKSPHREDWN